MRTITNRDMQNPDEPNLPFAQSFPIHVEAPIPINFGQSNRPSKYVYYEYIVNGDHWTFGKMVNRKFIWTEDNAKKYRAYGYDVRKVSDIELNAGGNPTDTGGGSGGGSGGSTTTDLSPIYKHIDKLYTIHKEQEDRITAGYKHRLEIEKTKGKDFSGDIKKLFDIHKEQEDRITAGYEHRLSIEDKVNKAKAEHQNIWDRTDFSNIGHTHDNGNGNGKDCGWDIPCHIDKLKGWAGGVAIIGGVVLVGYFLLKRKFKL